MNVSSMGLPDGNGGTAGVTPGKPVTIVSPGAMIDGTWAAARSAAPVHIKAASASAAMDFRFDSKRAECRSIDSSVDVCTITHASARSRFSPGLAHTLAPFAARSCDDCHTPDWVEFPALIQRRQSRLRPSVSNHETGTRTLSECARCDRELSPPPFIRNVRASSARHRAFVSGVSGLASRSAAQG